ncbi:hypothetical protein BLOT_014847, partial [Blomia tropicalis]
MTRKRIRLSSSSKILKDWHACHQTLDTIRLYSTSYIYFPSNEIDEYERESFNTQSSSVDIKIQPIYDMLGSRVSYDCSTSVNYSNDRSNERFAQLSDYANHFLWRSWLIIFYCCLKLEYINTPIVAN